MELGQRLRQARQAAGLSQRQLCGDTITRNMLSQIENGTARPSMQTLEILAERLGKPLSWFLDEKTLLSNNTGLIRQTREALASGGPLLPLLRDYAAPDPVYDPEYRLLLWTGLLREAETALETDRPAYARELLDRAEMLEGEQPLAAFPELTARRLALLFRAEPVRRVPLPSLDDQLLLRAEAAEDPTRAAALLDACEDRESPRWNLLRGRCYVSAELWQAAAACLHQAEAACPKETVPLLERCCKEQGDFRGAYFYACKQRESDG